MSPKSKTPEEQEAQIEQWMQTARRTLLAGVPNQFTFRVAMTEADGVISVYVWFVATGNEFKAKLKHDPVKFVQKEIIPWIKRNGQHV